MSLVIAALAPIFLLIALGWLLRRLVFRGDDFWEPIEKLTYFVLFPALLIHSMATAKVTAPIVLPVFGILAGVMLIVAGILVALGPRLASSGAAYTSVFQGSVRFNTYIGLAAAVALYGANGTALLAVLLALLIPLSNIVSVLALARHARGTVPDLPTIAMELALNPLILASLAGLVFSALGWGLPPIIGPTLDILGRGALPMGLIAVGAGLNFGALKGNANALAVSVVLKLLISPLLAWAGCRAIGIDSLSTAVAVLFAALPPAPSAFILARRMGGDHALMACVITVHTVLAAITLPLILSLIGSPR
jgi:malonate transporter and related proteins